jgi:uncharacterized protein
VNQKSRNDSKSANEGFYGRRYFWRTYQGQEIDFVEEIENQLMGFEAKWFLQKKDSAPTIWKKHYPTTSFPFIIPENYLEYITKNR